MRRVFLFFKEGHQETEVKRKSDKKDGENKKLFA